MNYLSYIFCMIMSFFGYHQGDLSISHLDDKKVELDDKKVELDNKKVEYKKIDQDNIIQEEIKKEIINPQEDFFDCETITEPLKLTGAISIFFLLLGQGIVSLKDTKQKQSNQWLFFSVFMCAACYFLGSSIESGCKVYKQIEGLKNPSIDYKLKLIKTENNEKNRENSIIDMSNRTKEL